MRTGRVLTVSPSMLLGGCLPLGGSAPGGGVCSWGVSTPREVSAPGGVCSRGSVCSRGWFLLLGGCLLLGGVCSEGCLLLGVYSQGNLLQGVGVCSGGCLLQGVSALGVSAAGGRGVCSWEVSAPMGGGGCLLWEGCVYPQHALRQTPPTVNRITDACENITLPQLRCGR